MTDRLTEIRALCTEMGFALAEKTHPPLARLLQYQQAMEDLLSMIAERDYALALEAEGARLCAELEDVLNAMIAERDAEIKSLVEQLKSADREADRLHMLETQR